MLNLISALLMREQKTLFGRVLKHRRAARCITHEASLFETSKERSKRSKDAGLAFLFFYPESGALQTKLHRGKAQMREQLT